MAKIVDPDQLNQTTEVDFNTSTKKIALNIAGNLDDNSPGKTSGVAHQALYSFTKEEWLTDATLQPIRFPFLPIFEAKFDWINNWQPEDQQTIDLIRDSGFRVVLLSDEYAGILSLQNIDDATSDRAYYWQTSAWTASVANFDKTGELNEPILIYDGTNDYRDFLKVALRVPSKTYGYGNLLIDQDLSALTYQAYRIPISNTVDTNIDVTDTTIDGTSPYTEMQLNYLLGSDFSTYATSSVYAAAAVMLDANTQVSASVNGSWWFTPGGGTSGTEGTVGADTGITDWEAYAGQTQFGTEWYAFNRIINISSGSNPTALQYYNWAMRQLRSSGSINSDALGSPNQDGFGVVTGSVAMELVDFIGTTLRTKPGVNILQFNSNDTNSLELSDITVDGGGLDTDFVPVTSTVRTYPFVAAGDITFSSNLVDEADVDTIYTMFFQYTTRDTGTDINMASASVNFGTLGSTTTDFTTNFTSGDYVKISGFSNTTNNGIFQVTGSVIAVEMDVRKVNGQTLIDEAAGATVNLDNDPYDSPDAIIVNNNAGSPITGQITAATISFDFDYNNNDQGGRTINEDAPVSIEAQGKGGAQWIDGNFTITRATGLAFPLNAADERVYTNP